MMSNSVQISPITNADSEAAAALILNIQQGEFKVPITLADQPDLLDLEAFYFRPGGHFWGAFVDGELAGTIGLLTPVGAFASTHATSAARPMGVIRKMFVKQAFRGRDHGIAQKLLETLLGYATERRLTDIYLGTLDTMAAAHRFYERNGFVRMAEADLPVGFPRMAVDNTFYQLKLT